MDIDATRPVYDRLLQYATKLNEKKQLQSEIGHRPIDRNTGRELFTPLTGRRPQTGVSILIFFLNFYVPENGTSAPIVDALSISGV